MSDMKLTVALTPSKSYIAGIKSAKASPWGLFITASDDTRLEFITTSEVSNAAMRQLDESGRVRLRTPEVFMHRSFGNLISKDAICGDDWLDAWLAAETKIDDVGYVAPMHVPRPEISERLEQAGIEIIGVEAARSPGSPVHLLGYALRMTSVPGSEPSGKAYAMFENEDTPRKLIQTPNELACALCRLSEAGRVKPAITDRDLGMIVSTLQDRRTIGAHASSYETASIISDACVFDRGEDARDRGGVMIFKPLENPFIYRTRESANNNDNNERSDNDG